MSFSFNEFSDQDNSCEIRYLGMNNQNQLEQQTENFKNLNIKQSPFVSKTIKCSSNNIFNQLNLTKNSFSYDNNTNIDKTTNMNSNDFETQINNNYNTNFQVNNTSLRRNTSSGISKYICSPIKKFSNTERFNKNNKFLNNKKNFEITNKFESIGFDIDIDINPREERDSIHHLIPSKPKQDITDKRKSEIVSDYINKLKENDRFGKFKNFENRKSKFSIFEERVNESKKAKSIRENDKAKKKKSVLVTKIRESIKLSSYKLTFLNAEEQNKNFKFSERQANENKRKIASNNCIQNSFIEREDENDESNDSEKSQLSNLTNIEVQENHYENIRKNDNPFVEKFNEDYFKSLNLKLLKTIEFNKNILTLLKQNFSLHQKDQMSLEENSAIKENCEKIIFNLIKEVKILEKKCSNLKYEMNPFSPTNKEKNQTNKFNFFDPEVNHNNNNNNNNNAEFCESYNRSSNLSNVSSIFNNPNFLYNNEMNVDELIDELENKLSFIKLQNAQTMERLDYLNDDLEIKEKLNKDYVNKIKILEKELSNIQKRKVFGIDKIKQTDVTVHYREKISEISGINILVSKNNSNDRYILNKQKFGVY